VVTPQPNLAGHGKTPPVLSQNAQIQIINAHVSTLLPRRADFALLGAARQLHIVLRLGGITVQRPVPVSATREDITALIDDARSDVCTRMMVPAVTR